MAGMAPRAGGAGGTSEHAESAPRPAPERTPPPSTARDEVPTRSMLPSLSLPKGGGAIRAIGEKFSTNPATGTGSLRVPIPTSPGRAGFDLALAIAYDSGAGNGPFGIGWQLSTPAITRKTDKGLPRYLDAEESDVFVLSGAEDLVPVPFVAPDGTTRDEGSTTEHDVSYRVRRYRPRTEGLFARIERWTDVATGDAHWRAITRDDVINVYGKSLEARTADPDDPSRVFSWLLEETRDDHGNVARYSYKREDGAGVDAGRASESSRFGADTSRTPSFRATAQRYLKRIQYGNRAAVMDRTAPLSKKDDDYLFEVVFDYGEHDAPAPAPRDDEAAGNRGWPVRKDPFSSYRATFEVRTYRLCRRVLVYHRFAELGATPCLVRSLDFTYDEGPVVTYLAAVTEVGYLRAPGASTYERATLPPLELGYTKPELHDELRTIDPEALEGIASGVDGAGTQWVDLDGEGIPGVLIAAERAWYYKANLGEGKLAPPKLLRSLPAPAELGREVQLADIGGDGNLDVVRYAPPNAGYFERTPEGSFLPFVTLPNVPNIDWNDPNLRFLDLDGDGLPDVLVTEHDALVFHRSRAKQGFEPAIYVTKPKDERRGPAVVFADGTETIQLADMSGDGLVDIVRVREGEVSYWPNLGQGQFGGKITLDRSPRFDAPDCFDPRRVRFADIDGSGTSDVVYLGRDGVRIYFNESGNGLSEGRRIGSLPPIDSASRLQVVDLLGQGTACLVWSSPLPGARTRPIAYVDLMGGEKPHVLDRIVNNLGGETRIAYAPSTKFYLRDAAEGRPWLTRLPFPVHVIERVERYDHVARSKLVTTFAYHHGYFDGEERELRGFARVEQRDAESFSGERGRGLFPEIPYDVDPANEDLELPPVRTVTWYHTGAWLERERFERALAREYYGGAWLDRPASGRWRDYFGRDPSEQDPRAAELFLPDTVLEPSFDANGNPARLTIQEEREAARALRGLILRQEVYAEDGTPAAAHPYSVSERNYRVRRIQGAAGRRHAIFFAHPLHVLDVHYERGRLDAATGAWKNDDPRVQHDIVLAVDEHGNPTLAAAIAYPRRAPVEPEQARLWATISEQRFAHRANDEGTYRVSVPIESTTSELAGLAAPARGVLSDAQVKAALAAATEIPYEAPFKRAPPAPPPAGPTRRVVDKTRHYYHRDYADVAAHWADALGPLPLGDFGARALPHQSLQLAMTPGLVEEVHGTAVPDTVLRDEARYVEQDGNWWARSGRSVFDPSRFFMVVGDVDPFGARHQVRYDGYALLAVDIEDPVGNRVTSGLRDAGGAITRNGNDYRVLAPSMLCDPNRNRTAVTFDALGMVVQQWQMGREGTGDGDPADRPGVVVRYDLDAWKRGDGPVFTHVATREVHGAGGDPFVAGGAPRRTGFQHVRTYHDGSARTVMRKVQAEPGDVPVFDANGRVARRTDGTIETRHEDDRWVGSGRAVFDNKGNPIKQYEPFFSASLGYEDEETLVEWGVTAILRYDPLGRLVRVDEPNGSHTRVVFDPWREEAWDENDTVVESRWYEDRGAPSPSAPEPAGDPEERAAWLAARHARTPAVSHLDALGRAFLVVVDAGPDSGGTPRRYPTRSKLDIEGNQLSVTDARGNETVAQTYDLLGRAVRTISADAGESRVLFDVGGATLRAWDPRGHVVQSKYDAVRRPTHTLVEKEGVEEVATRTVYGEIHPGAEARNLRGRVFRVYDGAGALTHDRFDFKGNTLGVTRRLALEYRDRPNWSPLDGATTLAGIESAASSLLEEETESFTTTVAYDALNRVTSRVTPDGSDSRPAYNQSGLLESILVYLRGSTTGTTFVRGIRYNARGQRESVEYGNGTATTYEYEPETFRLTRSRTTRTAGPALQDLSYTYDPIGNIVAVRDAVSYGNPNVSADGVYEYDAIYRLTRAEGREHPGQQPTDADAARIGLPAEAHASDWQALRRYRETYLYDEVGNLLEMAHRPIAMGPGGWTRRYDIDEKSNLLLGTSVPGDLPGTFSAKYQHDEAGQMSKMPHLPGLEWDWARRLQHVQKQDGDGAENVVYFAYDLSGRRARKVYEHSGIVEERISLGGYEVYRKRVLATGALTTERQTLHVMDDQKRIALVETLTVDSAVEIARPVPRLRHQLGDHLGSSTMEVDGAGGVISYEEYAPYGSTAFRATSASTEVSDKVYRYLGKERDQETGLHDFGARLYAAWLGRWTSADPLGLADGPCPYAYARDNPITLVDRDGMQAGPWTPFIRGRQFEQAVVDAGVAVQKKVGSLTTEVVEGDFHEGDTSWGGVGASVGVGLIPGVGQAADLRDTTAAVKKVWEKPTSGWAWGQLGMAAVGWFPGIGDAVKGLGKAGKKAGKEVLEAEAKVAKEVLEKEAKAAKELAEKQAKELAEKEAKELAEKEAKAAQEAAAKEAKATKEAAEAAKATPGPVRNAHLAGKTHPKTGVPFDKHGYPDFAAFRHPDVKDVRIQLSGSRSTDFSRANAAAGLKETPAGYTWHHHQDKGLMQLIETKVHKYTGHTGGFSQ